MNEMMFPFFAGDSCVCATGFGCCRWSCCLLDGNAAGKLHAPPLPPTPTHVVDLDNSKCEEREGMDTAAVKSAELTDFAMKVLRRIEAFAAKLGHHDDENMLNTNLLVTVSRRKAIVPSSSPARRVKYARGSHLRVEECGGSYLAFNCHGVVFQ